jgi:hypothetical protein
MNYRWINDARVPRQHWLVVNGKSIGLVYEINPTSFSVYGENPSKNPYARVFLGVMPTLEEAQDFLVTITASQQL